MLFLRAAALAALYTASSRKNMVEIKFVRSFVSSIGTDCCSGAEHKQDRSQPQTSGSGSNKASLNESRRALSFLILVTLVSTLLSSIVEQSTQVTGHSFDSLP